MTTAGNGAAANPFRTAWHHGPAPAGDRL